MISCLEHVEIEEKSDFGWMLENQNLIFLKFSDYFHKFSRIFYSIRNFIYMNLRTKLFKMF